MRGAAAGQSRTQGAENQPVEEKEKEGEDNKGEQRQPHHVVTGHGQHVANEKIGVTREITAARKDNDAERNGESHHQADRRVGRQSAAATNPRDGQSEQESEPDHRPERIGQTENHPKGYAGESGMPDRLGKKGHAVGHHHGAEGPEQRRNEKNGEQGMAHELVTRPLEGQRRDESMPGCEERFDHDSECRLNASRTRASRRTSAGGPSQTMQWSRKTMRSAKRANVARSCETSSTARSNSRRSLESSS